jgi:hypothetical protein
MTKGLYANIHAKRETNRTPERRLGKTPERMRSSGDKGAPTSKSFKQSAKTAKTK